MSKIYTMLSLQQELNDNTNGLGWEEGKTKQGKIIDWKRCIYLESAELVESYPWKHWKNIDAKVDYENVKIELVDIWHFVMSEMLRVNKIEGENLSIEQLSQKTQAIIDSIDAQKEDDYYAHIEAVESFIKELFCNFNLDNFIKSYFELNAKLGLSFDELFKLYLGKNILNQFRQDNGYKEGSYKKIWNGKEDNVVMQDILDNNEDIDAQGLYEILKIEYGKVVGN